VRKISSTAPLQESYQPRILRDHLPQRRAIAANLFNVSIVVLSRVVLPKLPAIPRYVGSQCFPNLQCCVFQSNSVDEVSLYLGCLVKVPLQSKFHGSFAHCISKFQPRDELDPRFILSYSDTPHHAGFLAEGWNFFTARNTNKATTEGFGLR
jgi:hypothetical protein